MRIRCSKFACEFASVFELQTKIGALEERERENSRGNESERLRTELLDPGGEIWWEVGTDDGYGLGFPGKWMEPQRSIF